MTRQSQLRWSEVKVGLVLLTALIILAVMIMNLEEGMGLFRNLTRFRATVPHTQGLKVGGPVRMNGVDVGNVREIAIARDQPKVEITFTVQKGVAAHIREDASVRIRPMGLLGDKFLEILPGTPSKPPLSPGSLLVGTAETDLTGIASGATATIDRLDLALQDLQQIMAALTAGKGTASKLLSDPSLYNQSQRVLQNLEVASEKSIAVLDKIQRGEGTVGRLVSDSELYDRANHAVRELTELAAKLNNPDGTLVKLSDPAVYKRLETLTKRSEELLSKVENGEGTVGKLITRDELYVRADKLLTEMEAFLADVKKNPTKYFKFSVF